MLKVRDNFDLEKLKEYGFEKKDLYADDALFPNWEIIYSFRPNNINGAIVINDDNTIEVYFDENNIIKDKLYGLVKDGVVVKV